MRFQTKGQNNVSAVLDPKCPRCSGRTVGRVGVNQFYCGECCIEFFISVRGTAIYEIADDGSLVPALTGSQETCLQAAK